MSKIKSKKKRGAYATAMFTCGFCGMRVLLLDQTKCLQCRRVMECSEWHKLICDDCRVGELCPDCFDESEDGL